MGGDRVDEDIIKEEVVEEEDNYEDEKFEGGQPERGVIYTDYERLLRHLVLADRLEGARAKLA